MARLRLTIGIIGYTDAMEKKKPATPEKSFGQLMTDFTSKPMPRSLIVALLVALGISALSLVLMEALGGAAKFRDWIEGTGAWAPLAYVGLKAATYVFAPLSGTPVKLAGGALFGFWDGAALVLLGDMLGASLCFWIARVFRNRGITRFAGKNAIKQIDDLTEHVGGWRALLAARLFLSSLYDFISYAAGVSKLPYRQFFWVSLLAGIPSTLSAAWLGDAAVTNKPFLYGLFAFSAITLVAMLYLQRAQSSDVKPKD
jgi:uncharacterized membrane protein YdjX (TVP38/TMEM64 family)